MAAKEVNEETELSAGSASAPKGPLIIALVNTVVLLAAMGMLVYTKLFFKRPPITETEERARLILKTHSSQEPIYTPGYISFDPITVNIESYPAPARPADGTPQQIQGKLHYATVGFVLEIRDITRKEEAEIFRPLILDKLLTTLGKKKFHELNHVQGRYILRTQMIDLINQIMTQSQPTHVSKDGLITNLFFTHFMVQ